MQRYGGFGGRILIFFGGGWLRWDFLFLKKKVRAKTTPALPAFYYLFPFHLY